MAYLDHAATTPMLPEALEAYVADRAARSATPRPCTRRPPGPAAGGGGPGAGRRGARRPAVRGDLHRRRHRERQPRGQGHLLGPPGGRPGAQPGAWPARSSTTRCWTPCDWLAEHEGAAVELAAGRRARAGSAPTALAASVDRARRRDRAGHRDVGEQRGRHGPAGRRAGRGCAASTASRSTPTRSRRSARCRSTSPASGAAALTVTGHKLGGPVGVGALLLGRDVACTPLLHGGGQERDVRSGTLDVAGDRGVRGRGRDGGQGPAGVRRPARPRCATSWWPRVARGRAGRGLNGDPVDRLPGNAHFSFPGCEGDALLLLLDAQGIACSTGSACSAGVAQPSHVLLAMGADDDAGPLVAAVHPRPHLARRPTSTRWSRALPAAVERAPAGRSAGSRRGRPLADGYARRVRVLAAMSGGVDSAVAAARAVDAGHDVTGVHLALARNPQTYRTGRARLLHAGGLPRRPPGRRRDRHPVLRLGHGRAVPRRRGGRLRRRVRGRPYPQPVPALQREDQVRGGAGPGGRARASTRWSPATTPGSAPTGVLRRSVDLAKDQSYVLAVLTREQLDRSMFPLGDSTKAAGARARRPRAAWPSPTSRTSHDICFIADGDTRGFLAERLGEAPGDIVDAGTGAVLGQHDGRATPTRWASGAGCDLGRPAPDGRPPLRAVDHPGDQHGDGRAGRGAGRVPRGAASVRCGPVGAADDRSSARCSCARTARPCRRR